MASKADPPTPDWPKGKRAIRRYVRKMFAKEMRHVLCEVPDSLSAAPPEIWTAWTREVEAIANLIDPPTTPTDE